MKIARNSWHARVYAWWYREKHGYLPASQGVNLCPYVRVVLFWAHMRLLFRTKLAYVTYPVLAGLLEWALFSAFGTTPLFVQAVIAILVAAAFALTGMGLAVAWLYRRFRDSHVGTSTASFTQVLVERVHAGHSKICPFMEFVDEDAKASTGKRDVITVG